MHSRKRLKFNAPSFLKRLPRRDGGTASEATSPSKRARMSLSPQARIEALGEDLDYDCEDDHAVLVNRANAPQLLRTSLTRRNAPSKAGTLSGQSASGGSQDGAEEAIAFEEQMRAALDRTSRKKEVDTYYLCMWRRPQFKVHKTWDGDAVLIVRAEGDRCSLRCADTFKDLVRDAKFTHGRLGPGDEIVVGGKEIEIDREISEKAFIAGKPFSEPKLIAEQKTAGPSRPSARSSRTAKAFLSPALKSNTSAPTSSFYGKPESLAIADDDHGSEVLPLKITRPVGPSGLVNPGSGKNPHPRHDPDAEGAIVMPRPPPWHEGMFNRRKLPVVDVVIDPILGNHLRPHQVDGVRFLYEKVMGMKIQSGEGDEGQGAILADEMGLGKTLQVITLVHTLLRQNCYYSSHCQTIERAMIVCPLSLVKNWKREFRKWLGPNAIRVLYVDGEEHNKAENFLASKTYQILVIGYEKLRTCARALAEAQPPIGLIVCDEGHRLKSKDAKTTKMFDYFSTPRRILLTGTPMQNDLSEFYAMIAFVSPALLMDYPTFRRVFEEPITKSRVQHCRKEVQDLGRERSHALQMITKTVILRRTAALLADYLPPQCEQVIFCSPSPLQLQVYSAILKSGEARETVRGHGGNILNLILILRKLCNTPELLFGDSPPNSFGRPNTPSRSEESTTQALIRVCEHMFPRNASPADVKLSGKLQSLSNLLMTIRQKTDDKVVLVSSFTSTLDVLETFCRKARYSFVRLDGKTKQSGRMDIVNNFNRWDAKRAFIFLLSTKTGGVGLNLIGANRLVLLDSDWNPSTDRQAIARIHRDGQKKKCYIYRMLLAGTIDEKIYQRQISKQGLSDALIDSANGSHAHADSFSPEELRDLFTLHTDSPCVSHDQLGCVCSGKGIIGEGAASFRDKDDNDEDTAAQKGFMPASQHDAAQADAASRDKRVRLAALHQWAHFDCTEYGAGNAPATMQDDILRQVVAQQVKTADESPKSPSHSIGQVSSSPDGADKAPSSGQPSGGIPKQDSMLERLAPEKISAAVARQEERDTARRASEQDNDETIPATQSVSPSPSASAHGARVAAGMGVGDSKMSSATCSLGIRRRGAHATFDVHRVAAGNVLFVLEKMSAAGNGDRGASTAPPAASPATRRARTSDATASPTLLSDAEDRGGGAQTDGCESLPDAAEDSTDGEDVAPE